MPCAGARAHSEENENVFIQPTVNEAPQRAAILPKARGIARGIEVALRARMRNFLAVTFLFSLAACGSTSVPTVASDAGGAPGSSSGHVSPENADAGTDPATTPADAGSTVDAGAAADSDVAPALPPGACTTTDDCGSLQCLCVDGKAPLTARSCFGGKCVDFTSACTTLCASHGGLVSSRPQPTVIGSAECTAFLAKIVSLGCANGPPDPHTWCGEAIDECDASKRAELQCETDHGTWTCDDDGVGWSMTSICGRFTDRCP
jgi:hypothetical protein